MGRIDIFEFQEGLYYSNEHTWARVEDGLVRVGLDDFYQKLAGIPVYVELPSVGEKIQQMKPLGVIVSKKAFSSRPKGHLFDLNVVRLLANRAGFCQCVVRGHCPCIRYINPPHECPCQNYIPVSYLIAPLSGVVKEVNRELEDKPWIMSEDPYGKGWIAVLEPSNLDGELKNLLTDEAANKWLIKEIADREEQVEKIREIWQEILGP